MGDTDGATSIEYALTVALISVAIIATASSLGVSLSETFENVKTALIERGDRVDLQAADSEELETIVGIGPNRAGDLIRARNNGTNLNTASETELQQIDGIGPVTAGKVARFRSGECPNGNCGE